MFQCVLCSAVSAARFHEDTFVAVDARFLHMGYTTEARALGYL